LINDDTNEKSNRRIVMKRNNHIKGIAHITIGVGDLKKAVSFYEDTLGLEKIGEWSSYAVFDIGGVSFGLQPKGKQENYLLVDDVDKAYRSFKNKGVKFITEPKDQPWGGRTATFVDPDGNKFIIETFHCKTCDTMCHSYRELLEEHLKKHE